MTDPLFLHYTCGRKILKGAHELKYNSIGRHKKYEVKKTLFTVTGYRGNVIVCHLVRFGLTMVKFLLSLVRHC